MRIRATCSIITAVVLQTAVCGAQPDHPVLMYTQYTRENTAALEKTIDHFMNIPEEQLIALVPTQNGFYFTGCPNCDGGQQEHGLAWDPTKPHQVHCIHCGHVYPSEKYPASGVQEVTSPAGNRLQYPYWADPDGYRYYFASFGDYEARRQLSRAAYTMAYVYHLTGDADYARRSALILNRFAEVYGDYIYKFDYPFQQKELYNGEVAPADFRPGFRTSRWDWWAYMDIPLELVHAYDMIVPSGELDKIEGAKERIASEFFLPAADQVMANPDTLSNMSPTAWQGMVVVGRVLDQPEFVHEVIDRLGQLAEQQFYYDGAWREGAPSYHSQVVGGLSEVFRLAAGYSDPPDYKDPLTGRRLDELDLKRDVPALARTIAALDSMRLPNGRLTPVHDTWSTNGRGSLQKSVPVLLPALGHAILGRGEGENQMQVNLTWSGGYGHQHHDGLAMHLFARGEEMLPDLGYTHTRFRGWTIATASHNTVVVDFENQYAGADPASDGALQLFDVLDADFQVVMVDNPQVYPGRVEQYSRLLALVGLGADDAYVVDAFRVKGGQQHDYFLHGSADVPQTLSVTGPQGPLETEPVETMLPEDFPDWRAPEGEHHGSWAAQRGYAYGFLKDGVVANLSPGVVTADFTYEGRPLATRVYLAVGEHDQLYSGLNPQVRPAGNDDSKLPDYYRPYIMLGRFPAAAGSLFVSVIEPRAETARIRSVEAINTRGEGRAVAVTTDEFTDIIGLYASDLTGSALGREFSMTGPIGRLRIVGDEVIAAYSTGNTEWGEFALKAEARTAKLTATMVGGGGGALCVDADWTDPAPPPGSVVIVDHGDGFTHGYTVKSVAAAGGGSIIGVEQDPGFQYDPVTGTATFVTFPQHTHAAPQTVRQPAAAAFRK